MKKSLISLLFLLFSLNAIFMYGFDQQNIEQLRGINIILVGAIILLSAILVYSIKIFNKDKIELKRLKLIVDNSDNVVMITDKAQKVQYVNKAFTNTTGFSKEEIIGRNPKVVQSGQNAPSLYKNLNETIYAKKKWHGTFVNKNKDGTIQYEKATIVPLLDDAGEIVEFIGLKYDITKELDAEHTIKEKEQKIFNHAKMASMGELLHNIAHHWRQPLSLISTVATSIELQQEMNMLTPQKLTKGMDDINKSVQNLSTIIEDFANFFQTNKPKEYCSIKDIVQRSVNILGMDFVNNKIIFDIDEIVDVNLYCYDSELIQAILNILTNAKDAVEFKDEKVIKIRTIENLLSIDVIIEDSGGGILDGIEKNMFEPYFTTKHKSKGTGMGLYNSYNIVVNRLDGDLSGTNSEFEYKNKKYFGAKFTITIPKSSVVSMDRANV